MIRYGGSVTIYLFTELAEYNLEQIKAAQGCEDDLHLSALCSDDRRRLEGSRRECRSSTIASFSPGTSIGCRKDRQIEPRSCFTIPVTWGDIAVV